MQYFQAVQKGKQRATKSQMRLFDLAGFAMLTLTTKKIDGKFAPVGEVDRVAIIKTPEGYKTILTGRSSTVKPESMVPEVDVVIVCVPISATRKTIEKYAPLLKGGQALILLAGEAENNINTALEHTKQEVEVMLVHNLWGPQAKTMKDKNLSLAVLFL